MERYPVESTFAKSVGYDHYQWLLEIETVAGKIYQLKDVPMFRYMGLVTGTSVGRYYNRYLKHCFEHVEVFEQHIPQEQVTETVDLVQGLASAVVDELFSRIAVKV